MKHPLSLHLHLTPTPLFALRTGRALTARHILAIHFSLFTLHFSLFTLPSSAAVPLKWTVETSRVQPVAFDAVHGESIALEAAFKSYGTDVITSNQTAFLCWQTNGMGSAWWTTNATTSGTSASVLFTPAMDPGAPSVTGFIGLTPTPTPNTYTSISYRALFTLRFRKGPGATPNTLDLPTPVIDCATVTFLNPSSAPWSGGGSGGGVDTNAVRDIVASASVTNAGAVAEAKEYTDSAIIAAGAVTPSDVTNISAYVASSKRDLTNNVCAADSFTAWSATPPSGYTFGDAQPVFDSTTGKWTWYVEGTGVAVDAESGASTASATSATFAFEDSGTKTFPATRARVAYSNDTFTTYSFVTNIVASASVTNAGAKAYADSKFVPYDGATNDVYLGDHHLISSGYIQTYDRIYLGSVNYMTNLSDGSGMTFAGPVFASDLIPDGSPVATSNMVTRIASNTTAIVQSWESFLDGSNVVFSITNYVGGSYSLDHAKLRILELTNNVYREVYNSHDEIALHVNYFKTNDFATATNSVISGVTAAIAGKADKDWGKYTSAGGESPSNTVYITAPNTVFAGGMEYERVAVGEGSICVLTTKGAPTWAVGDEGTFKFQDDGGTNYFGFAKSDSYTIGCDTDGITVSAANLVTLTYEVTMSGVPCIWFKADITSSNSWEQLNRPDGTAIAGASHTVSWDASPAAGTEVCYINCANEQKGFFKATIEVEGYAKFMTNMPADLSGGIMATNTTSGGYITIEPYVQNGSILWRVKQ